MTLPFPLHAFRRRRRACRRNHNGHRQAVQPDTGDEQRRCRPVADLTPFEVTSYVGAGGTLAELQAVTDALASGWALEVRRDGRWTMVDFRTSGQAARRWVAEPGRGPCSA